MTMDNITNNTESFDCDVLVIGGGTAGPMAALKAKQKNPDATVEHFERTVNFNCEVYVAWSVDYVEAVRGICFLLIGTRPETSRGC